MAHSEESNIASQDLSQPQPAVLVSLLLALNATRRQMSLYGVDHPSIGQSADELSNIFKQFAEAFGRSTLVFTKTVALINEHGYAASSESQELFHRLRVRGVMAITMVAPPPKDQIIAFVDFLNVDPEQVRSIGGGSAFLRKRGVSLIVATDAVYTSGDGSDETDASSTGQGSDPEDMDRALGTAIDWLLRQDDDEDEAPRLPIAEILSSPDEAAKLIREAVTKLHASRRHDTKGEIASDVVHDLKDLASDDQDGWDSATPQIRKAMSKLPKGMRPEVAGFTEEDESGEDNKLARTSHIADIFEIENQIAEVLNESLDMDAKNALPAPDTFSALFGASPSGLLSSWRRELQPVMVMGSSGRTLDTLMIQETRANEHERIARALASLLPRSIEMKDFVSARAIADSLVRETNRGDSQEWRCVNARSALLSLDRTMLKQAIQAWATLADPVSIQSACQLVETMPELALAMIDLLGDKEFDGLGRAVARGIVGCGAAAVGPLGRLLVAGTDGAKDLALDALIELNTTAAIREIGRAFTGASEAFAIRALGKLSFVKHPDIIEISVGLLNSSSHGVRCAALGALGKLAVPSSVSAIIRIASKRGMNREGIAEKIAALEALGRIDCDESRLFVEKTAARQPLLGKKRYATIRATAERVLAKMSRHNEPTSRAA